MAVAAAAALSSAVRPELLSTDWKAPARQAGTKNPIPSSQSSITRGKAVYRENCLSCHGASGKGDGPKSAELEPKPRDLSSPEVAGQSDGALYWKIAEGRRPMPSFRKLLSDDDRWHVINYVRSLGPTNPKKH